MSNKITPGPWKSRYWNKLVGYSDIIGENGEQVADRVWSTSNARAIAAVPEMIEMLKKWRDGYNPKSELDWMLQWEQVKEATKALLAKIEGTEVKP